MHNEKFSKKLNVNKLSYLDVHALRTVVGQYCICNYRNDVCIVTCEHAYAYEVAT
jgi:hypothetical protein